MPAIAATQEPEAGGSKIWGWPGQLKESLKVQVEKEGEGLRM